MEGVGNTITPLTVIMAGVADIITALTVIMAISATTLFPTVEKENTSIWSFTKGIMNFRAALTKSIMSFTDSADTILGNIMNFIGTMAVKATNMKITTGISGKRDDQPWFSGQ